MGGHFLLAWGGAKTGRREVCRISNIAELESTLDDIELSTMQHDCIYQVDLWLGHIKAGDPLLLQFVIGHQRHSSLLWHEHGLTLSASEEHIPPLDKSLRCVGCGEDIDVEPELTRIRPGAVRDALCLFILTGQRAKGITWIETDQD